jgi:ABC-type antimicrobial peptide transport system ATPase subunit
MYRCKHIPQPLNADPQAKAVVRASTSPTGEKLFFKISIPSKNFKIANPQTYTKTFGQSVAKLNTEKGCKAQTTRTPGHNNVLPQLAMTCKLEAECSYQTFVQVDSVVLRNRQLRQHANRCGLF